MNPLNAYRARDCAVQQFPCYAYDHYTFLEKDSDGWYRFQEGKETIPRLFSLKARKPV